MRSYTMTEEKAIEILGWKYEPPYDFYNNEFSDESVKELINEPYRFVSDEDNRLLGFYCTGTASQVPIGNQYGAYDQEFIDIGLGLRPDLTGIGLGYSFIKFILNEIECDKPVRLTVATFNKRAIRLYENVGFVPKQVFQTNITEFLTMVKEAVITITENDHQAIE